MKLKKGTKNCKLSQRKTGDETKRTGKNYTLLTVNQYCREANNFEPSDYFVFLFWLLGKMVNSIVLYHSLNTDVYVDGNKTYAHMDF